MKKAINLIKKAAKWYFNQVAKSYSGTTHIH